MIGNESMKRFKDQLPSNKLYVLSFVALLIISLGGLFYIHQSRDNEYQTYLQNCNNANQVKYANCLGDEVLTFANTNPSKTGEFLDYIYKNARNMQPIDLRSLSDDSHYAGMLMADKPFDLPEAAKACGDSFEGGCLHGFVMERLDDSYVAPDRLSAMADYCKPLKGSTAQNIQYLNCLHGVGHEIWAKGRTTLNSALAYCNPLQQESLKDACWSGALMEYSKTGVSVGHHSHTPVGVVALPCATLQAQYQAVCYTSQGAYSQYEPNHETPEASYKYCETIPSKYRESCKAAVSDRLNLAVGAKLD
jgi:hypothetical protein